ncbi:hypothetical protein AX16_005776 [Volvariella volvacea WC 439]|nr:hypothetical protein AX16_005776 [Volvariella volvacea WC 439]
MTSLNTDGIIREFLSYYALDTENSDVNWRSNNQDLLNIALTCRSFRNPALGILWHSLDSLDPLLRLLPQVDWQGGKHPINGSCPKSQARFDYYANKVKAFKFQPAANGETLHISPLPAVSIDKARGYLLRNLQSLFFDLRSAQPEFVRVWTAYFLLSLSLPSRGLLYATRIPICLTYSHSSPHFDLHANAFDLSPFMVSHLTLPCEPSLHFRSWNDASTLPFTATLKCPPTFSFHSSLH